jgi:hypothetical protein
MVVFFGLVEQLSQRLKPGRSGGAGGDSVAAEGGPDDPWVTCMQVRRTSPHPIPLTHNRVGV